MESSRNASGIKFSWWFYLSVALLVESCCLGVSFLGWMAYRGVSPAVIGNIGETRPVNSMELTRTPIPTPLAGFSLSPTPVWGASTPFSTPIPVTSSPEFVATPTITPGLPEFDTPPPGKIVYVCYDGKHDQICMMSADGRNRRQLTFESATSFYPSLSPDGEAIVFSSNRDGNFEIYMMDTAGDNVQSLSRNIGNCYAPEISPKGNRIVFTAESGGTQAIWVMRLDGSNARPLFEGSGSDIDPTWSPNALRVAFASAVSGDTLLYIANLESDNVYPVLRDAMAIGGRSSWSPDGNWLAFYAGSRGDHDIFIVSPEGGALQQLTSGGDNLGPSFSPDSQWIAFTSYRDGNNEIYILNLNSQQAYRITNSPKSDWQPRWGP